MSRTDPLLLDAARKLLRAVADPQGRRGDGRDRRAVWQALEDHGLTRAWLPEAAGGAGASLADGFAILTLAGEVALDVALAETLLAGWLAAAAGLSVPDGAMAPAGTADEIELDDDGLLWGRAIAVPFAREVDRLAVFGKGPDGDGFVALVDRTACSVEPRDNLAGEPRDTVIVDRVRPSAVATAGDDLGGRLRAIGAVARACQMAGALQGLLTRSVAYAGERVAFDRPIGKFQAIQHALARLAGEAAIALAASGSAADALASGGDADGAFLEVASAKIRVGEAAAAGAAIAHQVHGAIGFSMEHPLHLFTRRLWAWRDDFGTESAWAVELGAHVARRGADALWPMLAAR
ncbi:MAG: acyl-CoA dehydrogenase [Deltaproteobacteria bacterium]|nr:MAG: acyl-CoA dehydrogenase [Deltaproteobacteria bacterium]TMQ17945.1 MAG: acyl-CoA dehydrogenase [Deltaproteobacteria bacterium]